MLMNVLLRSESFGSVLIHLEFIYIVVMRNDRSGRNA